MKKCPFCAKQIQDEATKCGSCEPSTQKKEASAGSRKINAGISILVIIVASLYFIGLYGPPSDSQVCSFADSLVAKQLLAPATAKFPSNEEHRVTRLSDNKYVVSSYVDSQNAFGALIRRSFMVTLEIMNNGREAKLVDINFL